MVRLGPRLSPVNTEASLFLPDPGVSLEVQEELWSGLLLAQAGGTEQRVGGRSLPESRRGWQEGVRVGRRGDWAGAGREEAGGGHGARRAHRQPGEWRPPGPRV